SIALTRNQVQLPFFLPLYAAALALPPLFFLPGCGPLLLGSMYRFRARMEMMSWLSDSSPVSALKPRYEICGRAGGSFVSKHVVHPSFLYCSASLRLLSAKYVSLSLVGCCEVRRPRAEQPASSLLFPSVS